MSATLSQETRSEAVGVFDDSGTLQEAIDELLSAGFNRAEISLLASEHAVEEKLGHAYEKVEQLEDDLSVPRAAYISTESRGDAEGGLIGGLMYVGAMAAVGAVVATGGALATAISAAAVAGGTGGLIGSILAQWISRHHVNYLQEQIDHGGLLLWVRTRDSGHEKRAVGILSKHSAHDVHVHEFPKVSSG
jgi:hypothetical protein